MSFIRKIQGALAFVAVVACTTTQPPKNATGYTEHVSVATSPEMVPVWIDQDFTPAHVADIKMALGQWNIALNGWETFVLASEHFAMETAPLEYIDKTGHGLIILQHTSKEPIMAILPEGLLGWVMAKAGEQAHVLNIIEDAVGLRDMTAVVLHELGHILGLPDVPVMYTLMWPEYSRSIPCVDLFTVQALASIRDWNWKTLNWCGYPEMR